MFLSHLFSSHSSSGRLAFSSDSFKKSHLIFLFFLAGVLARKLLGLVGWYKQKLVLFGTMQSILEYPWVRLKGMRAFPALHFQPMFNPTRLQKKKKY